MSLKYIISVTDQGSPAFKKFASEAEKSTKSVEGFRKGLNNAALGVAAGAAAAVGMATAYTALTLKVAQSQDALIKQSRALGVSVEWMSAMGYAAERTGASQEALTAGMAKFSKRMVEAGQGNAGALDTFSRLGVSVTDTEGRLRSTEDVFDDVADSFAKMEEGAQKSALAQKVFEEGGVKLVGMLSEGRKGLEGLTKEAEKYGRVIGTNAAENAERFVDAFTNLKSSADGAIRDVVNGSMVEMTVAIEGIADLIANNKETFADIGNAIGSAVQTALPALETMLDFVGDIAEGWARIFKLSNQEKFNKSLEETDKLIQSVKDKTNFELFSPRKRDVGKFQEMAREQINDIAKVNKEAAARYARLLNDSLKWRGEGTIDFGIEERIAAEASQKTTRQARSAPQAVMGSGGGAKATSDPITWQMQRDKEYEEWQKGLFARRLEAGNQLMSQELEAQKEYSALQDEMKLELMTKEQQEHVLLQQERDTRMLQAQEDATLLSQIEESYQIKRTELQKKYDKERTDAAKANADKRYQDTMSAMSMTLSAMRGFGADQRAMMIGEAMMNIYGGAAKALNSAFPLNIFAWAQVASIGAQLIRDMSSVKMATGGDVRGKSHSQGGVMRELEGGEAVIPRGTAQEFGGFRGIMRQLQGNKGGGAVSVQLINPIGNREWFEREAIPMIREAAARA
jgi:hypothetical protein